jgi:hypothetical protein
VPNFWRLKGENDILSRNPLPNEFVSEAKVGVILLDPHF